MLHRMGLYGEYFYSIIEGKRKVEVRLNDDKRRRIQVGDLIEFVKVHEKDETLVVEVTELKSFDTFKEMYQNIPFHDFDCEGWTMEEKIEGTYENYTREQEKQWGTSINKRSVTPGLTHIKMGNIVLQKEKICSLMLIA